MLGIRDNQDLHDKMTASAKHNGLGRSYHKGIILVVLIFISHVSYELIKHRILGWLNEKIDAAGWGEWFWHFVLWFVNLRVGPVIPIGVILLLIIYRNRFPQSLSEWRDFFKNRDLEGRKCFDYKTENARTGDVVIGKGDLAFTLHFTPCDRSSVYLYIYQTVVGLIHFKEARTGTNIAFHGGSDPQPHFSIAEHEHAILKNSKGYFMQLRILSVRKGEKDEVCFSYQIDPDGRSEFKAL